MKQLFKQCDALNKELSKIKKRAIIIKENYQSNNEISKTKTK